MVTKVNDLLISTWGIEHELTMVQTVEHDRHDQHEVIGVTTQKHTVMVYRNDNGDITMIEFRRYNQS